MTIRPLTEIAEFQGCVALQREAWGSADIDIRPVTLFVTQSHIGGLVLGAFDGDRLVAFINATPGIRNGKPYWHSQMMAVANNYWNSGIGTQLKLAQRNHARERGVHLIEWTYDPLESKNAHLNINKLGTILRRYYVNLYGEITSRLQQGLESDRVIAEWWIDQPRLSVEGDVRRVRIPADIQTLKRQDLASAKQIQLRVRQEFLKNFQDDFFVAGFERKGEAGEYLFIPGASRVYQAD